MHGLTTKQRPKKADRTSNCRSLASGSIASMRLHAVCFGAFFGLLYISEGGMRMQKCMVLWGSDC